jgi:hypothetical protein
VGFFGFGSTSIRSIVVTGKLALARFSVQQTEGLRVDGWGLRYGWIGGQREKVEEWVDRRAETEFFFLIFMM